MNAQTTSSRSLAASPHGVRDFAQACADAVPLTVSVFVYGMAYGALAHSANHLSVWRTLSLSCFLFAGASQFTVLSLLQQSAPLFVIVSSVFLLNARQILYGLTLGPHLRDLSWRQLVPLAHGLTDESYSVTITAAYRRPLTVAYFAGAGASVFVPWQVSTLLGYALGGFIHHPETFGLDFAYIGAFIGLLVAQWYSPRRFVAGLLSLLVAAAASRFGGTTSAVICGAVTAFLCGFTAPAADAGSVAASASPTPKHRKEGS